MKHHAIPFSLLLSLTISGCLADMEEFEAYMLPCEEGKTICSEDGKQLLRCVNHELVVAQFCPSQCSEGACDCEEGEIICSEDRKQLLRCVEHKFEDYQSCPYLCSQGACNTIPENLDPTLKCTDKETKCAGDKGNKIYLCQGGIWKHVATCESSCENGSCVDIDPCANKTCPDNYRCDREKGGTCVKVSCNDNKCFYNNSCVNQDNHCGKQCLNCNTFSSHATAGTCSNNGTCQVTACEAGYHVYNNACEVDSTSNCGAHGKQCNVVANGTNACTNSNCVLTCNNGYHENGNSCISNNANNKFISIWNVQAGNLTIHFPTQQNAGNLRIDWGDNKINDNVSPLANFVSHTYSKAGMYTITIQGNINSWSCSADENSCSGSYCSQLVEIRSYGNTTFGSYAFCMARQLVMLPTENTPQFKTNRMNGAFWEASKFNQNISFWDTSNVIDMSRMFKGATAFNQPINNWDTSNVMNMNAMFYDAKSFNQPINNWDTSNVMDMRHMFYDANSFNQPLNNWDTSNVTCMAYMFRGATAFNRPLYTWNTSHVTTMAYMFDGATAFNQPLHYWNISNVTSRACKVFCVNSVVND